MTMWIYLVMLAAAVVAGLVGLFALGLGAAARETPAMQAPIGSIQEIREDDDGLYVRAQLYDDDMVELLRQAPDRGDWDEDDDDRELVTRLEDVLGPGSVDDLTRGWDRWEQ